MHDYYGLSRRGFLAAAGCTAGLLSARAWSAGVSVAAVDGAHPSPLRHDIVNSPVRVALHRAKTFTRVFQANESKPWMVRKAMAMREYFETVPLYLRDHDGIAGSVSELPGAMPVYVELGIGENGIYTSERPDRQGYLTGQAPEEICEYWMNRNMYGMFRTQILGQAPLKDAKEVPQTLGYKFISNQGHLSPGYAELLRVGVGGMLRKARERAAGEADAAKGEFLTAAETSLTGLSNWIKRYAEFLGSEAKRCSNAERSAELAEMSRVAAKIATAPPQTFREALQLIWFAHQSIHIEGHGYSCTPDRIDQLLLPYYEADIKTGRLDDATALRLAENFVLKMYDNSVWGPEHHLTQGLCLSGSDADGRDQTNRLSWLFVEAHTNLRLPEPLLWVRWHPKINQEFFDYCLSRLKRSTCFPMFWNDSAVTAGLMELGVSREDAFNFVAAGCNELAVPGMAYFNPGAHANYLQAVEATITNGKGYRGQWKWRDVAPKVAELRSFDDFAAAFGAYLSKQIEQGYNNECKVLKAQFTWGVTPLTSCFFDGCIERGRDMAGGTKYNILSCGGTAFANAVDCMSAVREVVYEKKQATLEEVAKACAANFSGYEKLRAALLAAPKHGNDDPQMASLVTLVERLRDEPVKAIC